MPSNEKNTKMRELLLRHSIPVPGNARALHRMWRYLVYGNDPDVESSEKERAAVIVEARTRYIGERVTSKNRPKLGEGRVENVIARTEEEIAEAKKYRPKLLSPFLLTVKFPDQRAGVPLSPSALNFLDHPELTRDYREDEKEVKDNDKES